MATTKPVCAPAWYTDPKVLVTDSWITEWKRRATGRPLCFSERINAITRTFLAIIVIATLFSFYNQDLQTTMTYSLVLGLIITLPDIIDMIRAPYIQEPEYQTVDGFRSPDMMEYTNVTSKINGLTDASNCVAPISPPPLPQSSNCDVEDDSMTMPSPRNPFMNVLIDEIKYNPKRPQAAAAVAPACKNLRRLIRPESLFIINSSSECFMMQWIRSESGLNQQGNLNIVGGGHPGDLADGRQQHGGPVVLEEQLGALQIVHRLFAAVGPEDLGRRHHGIGREFPREAIQRFP